MKVFKIRTPHINKEGRIFSWTSLIYSFGLGLLLPIFPTFIETIIKSESLVGYFYSAMSVAMFIAGITSAYFFRKFGRIKLLYFSLIVTALVSMFFVFVTEFYQLFPMEFLRVFLLLFVLMTLALMVHDFTAAKNLGKTEGVYFLFNNLGWLLGPITGGVIARYAGLEPVFVLSGVFLLLAVLYISHQHLVKKHPALALPHKEVPKKIQYNKLKTYLKNRNRIIAYFISVVFVSWISFKVIVVPLFVQDMGYGTDMSGLILSLAILPYVLFEVPIGLYADKHGLKKPIVWGFFILAFFVLGVKISPIFFLDALFIILANIGAAFVEPLHDVYFFRNVDEDEEDSLYGIFITADPIARFLAPALVSTSLILLPFEWVFAVFGAIFALAGVLCLVFIPKKC